MKVNRDILARGGLTLLNEVGLEQLTLRKLGSALNVQAAAMYWHFKSKEELIDEMATLVLAEAGLAISSSRKKTDWRSIAANYGEKLRSTLLRYRDGARMVAGTKLTDTQYMQAAESVGASLLEAGFTIRQAVVLLSTIFNYTQSFVIEEQSVFPAPDQRSDKYDPEQRKDRLATEALPLLKAAGPILFERFDRRYKEGLALIVEGAAMQLSKRR